MDHTFVIWFAAGLLTFLLLAAGCYAYVRFVLSEIDIISEKTAAKLKQSDPAFEPERFRGMIRSILDRQDFLLNTRVIFHDFPHAGRRNLRKLNANTALPGTGLIVFTPGWAAVLFRCLRSRGCRQKCDLPEDADVSRNMKRIPGHDEGTDRLLDFFVFTLGHEMTHKEGQYRPLFAVGRKRKFAGWVREVHADLGSLRKTGFTPERVESCIRGRAREGPDLSRGLHPSWEYRIAMMKRKNFDAALIDQIARDLGMNDRRFCRKVNKHYSSLFFIA